MEYDFVGFRTEKEGYLKTITVCLGENLKRLRQERGLTQESFAKKAKLSMSFIQLVERGKKWVGPKTITVLAHALQVSESSLFEDCDAQPEPDAKRVLLIMSKALGLGLTQEHVEKLHVRTPLGTYTALYDTMPGEIGLAFAERCQSSDWSWDDFRAYLKR